MPIDHTEWTALNCRNIDWHLTWDIISETAALATALRGEMPPVEHGSYAYVERIPYGVVFGIARKLESPSNYRHDNLF